MNQIEPVEGEELIVEITRTRLTEGSSTSVIRIGPTPTPKQEEPVVARKTTTVEAAVKTTVATTKITSTALTKQSNVPTKKPKASEPGGFFTDIWNFLTNSNDISQDKNIVKATSISESEPLKDTTREEVGKNEWYEWAKHTAETNIGWTIVFCVENQLCLIF